MESWSGGLRFRNLRRSRWEIFAPKGLQDSAQGFNPGNPENKWFALKGREVSR
jgi:hypothetical protein